MGNVALNCNTPVNVVGVRLWEAQQSEGLVGPPELLQVVHVVNVWVLTLENKKKSITMEKTPCSYGHDSDFKNLKFNSQRAGFDVSKFNLWFESGLDPASISSLDPDSKSDS